MKLNRDILRKLPLALRIEIEENAQRKALTQSELATEQRRILIELRKHLTPGARSDLKDCRIRRLTELCDACDEGFADRPGK